MEQNEKALNSKQKSGKLDKFFHISERGSSIKVEILAGLTTFMAMAYILMVNSDIFTSLGISYGAIYIATAISAIVGTILIGLLANLPLAQASGMGLNAFFVYTICIGLGLSYSNCLILVLLDGLVFVILTVTGLRKKIFNAIPKGIRVAIPAGIGLFIAFIGLQDAGIIVDNQGTLVGLVSLNFLGSATWASVMPILVSFVGFIAIAVLSKLNKKGAILYGILGSAVLYYLLGFTVSGFYDSLDVSMSNPFNAFAEWGKESFLKIFTKGFDFSAYLDTHSAGSLVLVIITSALAFCMVDMFDTLGTLYGACERGNLLDEEGNVPNLNKAMLADALATCTGAVCGTSTVTTFVESSAGVAVGGKTGFSSLVTALCFFVAMFLSPVAKLIPGVSTAAALVFVGVLMMGSVKNVEWNDISEAVPAFVTIAMMVLTYNISYGIGLGIISYVLIKLCTGKVKEINIVTVIIGVLFALTFFLTH